MEISRAIRAVQRGSAAVRGDGATDCRVTGGDGLDGRGGYRDRGEGGKGRRGLHGIHWKDGTCRFSGLSAPAGKDRPLAGPERWRRGCILNCVGGSKMETPVDMRRTE